MKQRGLSGLSKERRKEAGRKAAETRKKNRLLKEGKIINYDRPKKNRIRDIIIEAIRKEKVNTVLTLESPDFLMPKILKKVNFFVAENNPQQLSLMLERGIPNNVFLLAGDISQFSKIHCTVQCLYLDFCKTFESCEKEINILFNGIKRGFSYNRYELCPSSGCRYEDYYNNYDRKLYVEKLIGLTFCLRGIKKDIPDYKFDLIKKIQNVIPNKFHLVYAESYKDKHHSAMVTILLSSNHKLRVGNFQDRIKDGMVKK